MSHADPKPSIKFPAWASILFKRVLTVFIIALVSFILYRVFSKYDMHAIWKEVRATSTDALLLAGMYTALNYLVLTGYDTLAFKYIGKKLSYSRIGFTAFISYTFSHNVGAALVSGGAVRFRLYSKWGIGPGDITRVLLFSGFHFWIGLFVLGAIVCLIYPQDFADALHIPISWTVTIAIGMLIPVFYYLWLTLKPKGRAIRFREWRMEVPPLHLAVLALILACIDWMCAASVLYHLLPGYKEVHYTEVLVAFLAAQMGGVMSHVPGGFGVFESIFFVSLSDHYRDEALVGSLVLYRFFYYFAPFFVGAMAYIAYEGKLHRFPFSKKKGSVHTKD